MASLAQRRLRLEKLVVQLAVHEGQTLADKGNRR
jgi:hypothetical protein